MSVKKEDKCKIKGKFKIIIRDLEGNIIEEREGENLITNAGKNLIASVMGGVSSNLIGYVAVGSGTTAPNVNDTTLEGEIGRLPFTTKTVSGNQIITSTYFNVGDCNGTWSKVGVFDSASGGTLFCEQLIDPSVSKTTSMTATIDYTITFG